MRSPTCSSIPLLGLGAMAFGAPCAALTGELDPGFRNAAAEGARRMGVPTVGVDEPKPGSSTLMRDEVDGKMVAEVVEDMITSLEGAGGMGSAVDMPRSGRAMLEPSRASACAGSYRGCQPAAKPCMDETTHRPFDADHPAPMQHLPVLAQSSYCFRCILIPDTEAVRDIGMWLRLSSLSEGFKEFDSDAILVRRIAVDHHLNWL